MSVGQKRWPLFLGVSILINMLLLGFVLGGQLAERSSPPREVTVSPTVMTMVRHVVQMAPATDRPALREAFRDTFRRAGPERRGIRQARRRLSQALLSEPYDAAAVDEALANLREHELRLERRFHGLVAREVGRFDMDRRRALSRLTPAVLPSGAGGPDRTNSPTGQTVTQPQN